MFYPIPKGWQQVRRTTVRAGDMIRMPDGWADAEDIGRGKVKLSSVGHATAMYEIVIRKISEPQCKDMPVEFREQFLFGEEEE